jgi:hypothetical protein
MMLKPLSPYLSASVSLPAVAGGDHRLPRPSPEAVQVRVPDRVRVRVRGEVQTRAGQRRKYNSSRRSLTVITTGMTS